MAYGRDPVSELFDAGARRLLVRAYANPGQWVGTRIADPTPRHTAALARQGINPMAADNASATGGRGLNARTRWARGFVRALYYQHRWYSTGGTAGGWRRSRRSVPRAAGALEVEVGRAVRAMGIIPSGRAVRVRIVKGGETKRRAVQAMPDRDRIYSDTGTPGARWSDPAARDW